MLVQVIKQVIKFMINVVGVLQALMLLLQTAWGPRWFVPKRFLPAKYDYHRPVVPREVAEGVLDPSSSPPDVETGDGGEWSLTFAMLVKAHRKESTRSLHTLLMFGFDSHCRISKLPMSTYIHLPR